jgi:DNA-binding PadR family transcriptional regulator
MARPASPDGYPTLLLALLDAGPAHGYDLVQRLPQLTEGELQLPAGLVYPLLHGLEAEGLVSADWAPGAPGRRRRVYALTDRGRAALRERSERWARHRTAVDRLLLPPAREGSVLADF